MPTRSGAPTRAERSASRRQQFFQDRIDRAAGSATDTVSAGVAYLLAVLRQVEVVNPRKADQIATDTTEYLLRQANAHDDPRGGRR